MHVKEDSAENRKRGNCISTKIEGKMLKENTCDGRRETYAPSGKSRRKKHAAESHK